MWWNCYEEGVCFAEKGFFDEAIASFEDAIRECKKDEWNARIEGINFIDYFPNREMGIAYYYLGEFEKSKNYLECSLKWTPSDKALVYLERAYFALIQEDILTDQQRLEISVPEIHPAMSYPNITSDTYWTRNDPVVLSGFVKDKKYVKSIRVNGEPVFLLNNIKDIENQKVKNNNKEEFIAYFDKQLSLPEGEHTITVEAKNIIGDISSGSREVKFRVDRRGPMIIVNDNPDEKKFSISLSDEAGIDYLSVNEKTIQLDNNQPFFLSESEYPAKPVKILAHDRLKNETIAEIDGLLSSSALVACAADLTARTFIVKNPDISNAGPTIKIKNLDEEKIYVESMEQPLFYIKTDVMDKDKVVSLKVNDKEILDKNQNGNWISFSYEINLAKKNIIEATDEKHNISTYTITGKPSDKRVKKVTFNNFLSHDNEQCLKLLAHKRIEEQILTETSFLPLCFSRYRPIQLAFNVTDEDKFITQNINSSILFANNQQEYELINPALTKDARLSLLVFYFEGLKRENSPFDQNFREILIEKINGIRVKDIERFKININNNVDTDILRVSNTRDDIMEKIKSDNIHVKYAVHGNVEQKAFPFISETRRNTLAQIPSISAFSRYERMLLLKRTNCFIDFEKIKERYIETREGGNIFYPIKGGKEFIEEIKKFSDNNKNLEYNSLIKNIKDNTEIGSRIDEILPYISCSAEEEPLSDYDDRLDILSKQDVFGYEIKINLYDMEIRTDSQMASEPEEEKIINVYKEGIENEYVMDLLPESLKSKSKAVLPHLAGESISEYLSQKFPYKEGSIETIEDDGKTVAINFSSNSKTNLSKNSRVLIFCKNESRDEGRAENTLILKAALKNIQNQSNMPYVFAWIDNPDNPEEVMPKAKLFEKADIFKGCKAVTE
ncbi:MAG: hypothetical protein BWK80_03950 [Desulfobacteraceae bacterium IS3]|nr:MAG: hypothetical protein BWK80_03950 [Desulfobacteraceae bacterium IS3]